MDSILNYNCQQGDNESGLENNYRDYLYNQAQSHTFKETRE